jgi:hypothetical protein
MGIQTEKFKNDLIVLVNNCGLDISTAYYVLKDVLNITEKEYNKTLIKEQQASAIKSDENKE